MIGQVGGGGCSGRSGERWNLAVRDVFGVEVGREVSFIALIFSLMFSKNMCHD